MNIRQYFTIVLLLIVCNTFLVGQDLETETVEVVKDFEARLADAHKIKLMPAPEVKAVSDKRFDYILDQKIIPIEYLPAAIKALSLPTDPVDVGYRGFVKAGFGYPLSPYLDAGYLMGDPEANNLFARISHHSANDDNVENQRFSDSDFLLKGVAHTPYGFAVEGTGHAGLDNHYFYGYKRDERSFIDDDVRNKLNLFDLGIKLYNSAESESKFNYWAGFNAYRFGNNFATRETGLNIDLGLTKWFGNNPLSLTLGTDLSRLKDTQIRKINNFFINPTFSFGTQSLRFRMGGKLATSNEEYYVFPDVELVLNLAGNGLSLFAGADGGLRKNSFKILSEYNPFLVPELSDTKNSVFYDFYGGVKGAFSGIEYSGQIGFKPTDDLVLFQVNQDKYWNRFDVLYDTANIIYVQASLKGNLFTNIDISASIIKNIYDLTLEEEPWYLPKLQATAGISYLAMDRRLRLKGDIYFTDPVEYQPLDFPDEPNTLLDISLGADFYLTDHFGLFLHLNNLSANKYRRWYGYPGYGLNVLGGLTARF